jgi:LMBR1-like membrane protein
LRKKNQSKKNKKNLNYIFLVMSLTETFNEGMRATTLVLTTMLSLYAFIYFALVRHITVRDASGSIAVLLCTFSLAVACVAFLLVPASICHALSESLVEHLWQALLTLASLSLFFLMPFSFFFHEAEGLWLFRRRRRRRVSGASNAIQCASFSTHRNRSIKFNAYVSVSSSSSTSSTDALTRDGLFRRERGMARFWEATLIAVLFGFIVFGSLAMVAMLFSSQSSADMRIIISSDALDDNVESSWLVGFVGFDVWLRRAPDLVRLSYLIAAELAAVVFVFYAPSGFVAVLDSLRASHSVGARRLHMAVGALACASVAASLIVELDVWLPRIARPVQAIVAQHLVLVALIGLYRSTLATAWLHLLGHTFTSLSVDALWRTRFKVPQLITNATVILLLACASPILANFIGTSPLPLCPSINAPYRALLAFTFFSSILCRQYSN